MKKLMIAFAATAALVSVASADDATWFTGTIGSEAGGSWTMTPGDGEITTNTTTLALENATASFAATEQKALSGSANLNFATSAKFAYSYDELPAIDSDAKAGIVVVNNKYYVLAKDDTTNAWVSTEIDATLDTAVDVSVTITNGTDGAHALYQFGDSTAIDKLVVASGNWGTVDYKGSGEVASLVGTTTPLAEPGYPIPGGKTIPTGTADTWAQEQGIDPAKLAELLVSDTKYNGRTVAESCILGVGTNDNIKATVADSAATTVSIAVDCTPTIAGRVQFALKTNSDIGPKQSSKEFTPEIADGIYQVFAYVDDAETPVPASQPIGVKGTAVAATTVYYIGAPYADCAIADLFKKSCCTEDDVVEVYDAASDSYKSWKLTNGEWVFASGQVDPPASIKKGQAVKYTTATATAAGAKLYQIDDISEEDTTPIVKGKWNLVAYPDGELDATKLPLEATVDQAIVLDGVTTTGIFTKFGEDVYKKSEYNAAWSKEGIGTVAGGFFLKTKQKESVEWPAKNQE